MHVLVLILILLMVLPVVFLLLFWLGRFFQSAGAVLTHSPSTLGDGS